MFVLIVLMPGASRASSASAQRLIFLLFNVCSNCSHARCFTTHEPRVHPLNNSTFPLFNVCFKCSVVVLMPGTSRASSASRSTT
ncbi:hypothetical protein C8R48DRAFT_705394 [Suillus tomentosus]|nr:hypothetical protein C8R48DRAFT_705394 [Suillus tomentosus]